MRRILPFVILLFVVNPAAASAKASPSKMTRTTPTHCEGEGVYQVCYYAKVSYRFAYRDPVYRDRALVATWSQVITLLRSRTSLCQFAGGHGHFGLYAIEQSCADINQAIGPGNEKEVNRVTQAWPWDRRMYKDIKNRRLTVESTSYLYPHDYRGELQYLDLSCTVRFTGGC